MAWPIQPRTNVSGRMRDKILARSEPVTESGCWIWMGAVEPRTGKGQVQMDGKVHRAHRVAYQEFRGPIPEEMCVLHSCDVNECVNPAHLWLGTQQDNIADMVRKGRQRGSRPENHVSVKKPWLVPRGDRNGARTKPECLARGSRHGNAKLTEDLVREIRTSPERGVDIAKRLGLAKTTVSGIRRGHAWRHVLWH